MAFLRPIFRIVSLYVAVDELSAHDALDDFSARWDSKYPKISKSWYENWANLSTYFKFPQEMPLRDSSQLKIFPTDDSLFKMLYLAMKDITKKWTGAGRIGVKYMHSL